MNYTLLKNQKPTTAIIHTNPKTKTYNQEEKTNSVSLIIIQLANSPAKDWTYYKRTNEAIIQKKRS